MAIAACSMRPRAALCWLTVAAAAVLGSGCAGEIGRCGAKSCVDSGGVTDANGEQHADAAIFEAGVELGGSDLATDSKPPPGFPKGHIYLAGSANAEVFEFAPDLTLLSRFTHPAFGTVLPAPGQSATIGPQGMSFDAQGNLVVAAYKEFCVFSKPNAPLGCHPKVKAQSTENVIFDHLGNIYTTTSTGGTNEVHKYEASYTFSTTFSIMTGELTGITCGPQGNLFIASQDQGKGKVYQVDRKTFAVLDTIDVTLAGAGTLEGLQYLSDKSILVATYGGTGGVLRIAAASPFTLIDHIQTPGLFGAVPVTVDAAGNFLTADFENGSGTAPADLFIFDVTGKIVASNIGSPVYGPFGMVVAGVVLPCGAYRR